MGKEQRVVMDTADVQRVGRQEAVEDMQRLAQPLAKKKKLTAQTLKKLL